MSGVHSKQRAVSVSALRELVFRRMEPTTVNYHTANIFQMEPAGYKAQVAVGEDRGRRHPGLGQRKLLWRRTFKLRPKEGLRTQGGLLRRMFQRCGKVFRRIAAPPRITGSHMEARAVPAQRKGRQERRARGLVGNLQDLDFILSATKGHKVKK